MIYTQINEKTYLQFIKYLIDLDKLIAAQILQIKQK